MCGFVLLSPSYRPAQWTALLTGVSYFVHGCPIFSPGSRFTYVICSRGGGKCHSYYSDAKIAKGPKDAEALEHGTGLLPSSFSYQSQLSDLTPNPSSYHDAPTATLG